MIWQQLSLGAIVAAAGAVFYFRWRDKFGGPDGTRAAPGADLPQFGSFLLDFFMAGAGAVAAMVLTNFLGVQKLYGASVLTIILGFIILVAVFGFLAVQLYMSRNWKWKCLVYVGIVALVVACNHRP